MVCSHWTTPRMRLRPRPITRMILMGSTIICRTLHTAPRPSHGCHWLLLAISSVSLHISFSVSLSVSKALLAAMFKKFGYNSTIIHHHTKSSFLCTFLYLPFVTYISISASSGGEGGVLVPPSTYNVILSTLRAELDWLGTRATILLSKISS